ncbi:MAG: hypothetical protein WA817_09440 [Candidatus Acidiferrum sp.]
MPYFTAYIVLDIGQASFVFILYFIHGMSPATFITLAWVSESITLLAQALATTEILGITLRPYPGIWGLGWRAIAFTSTLVVFLVAITSSGHGAMERLFELNRGYHLTFATAVIACMLLVRYYSIQVPTAYKMILGGFCLNSCVEVLINTFVQLLFHKGYEVHQATWQFLTTLSFVAALVIWVVAVRKPFPAEDRQIASLSDSEYQRLSPQINEQLRLLNKKLLRLWKLEARSH